MTTKPDDSGSEKRSREQVKAPPIKPVYVQNSVGDTFDLGSVAASLGDKSNDAKEVRGLLRFTPSDRVEILVAEKDQMAAFRRMSQSGLEPVVDDFHLPYTSKPQRMLLSSQQDGHLVYSPQRTPIRVLRSSGPISKVVCHFFNWPIFTRSNPAKGALDDVVLVTGTPPLEGMRVLHRSTIFAGGWNLTICETEGASELRKAAGETGFAMTHVGEIVRANGDPFSIESVDEFLTCLHYYFSMCLAKWAGPTLAVGFDEQGCVVFEDWGMTKTSWGKWNESTSWMDAHNPQLLYEVFPGFWKLWMNQQWQESLKGAIYWYVGASHIGHGLQVDSALLLTQSALELLSWSYCVKDRKMLSEEAYKPRGLSAANKIRVLLSSLSIPLDIPKEISSLRARKGKPWVDSADAITDIRNGLVHPGETRSVPNLGYYDAWRISLWLLDLIFLGLCGHTGEYANRLRKRRVGIVDTVPWKT